MIVRCVRCGADIYECTVVGKVYSGTRVRATDFVPLNPQDQQPKDGDKMTCPRSGEIFCAGESPHLVLQLNDGSWWPYPPVR